ncbi:hypothetical protein GCM10009738_21950 [Kitasatospora viridis]
MVGAGVVGIGVGAFLGLARGSSGRHILAMLFIAGLSLAIGSLGQRDNLAKITSDSKGRTPEEQKAVNRVSAQVLFPLVIGIILLDTVFHGI